MNPTEQDEVKRAQVLRAGLEHMATPAFHDYLRLYAVDLWMRYAALKEAGFSDPQAMQIVVGRVSL